MWKELVLIASCMGLGLCATLELCPEGSSCHTANIKLQESSFEFLGKYSQKEIRSIANLTIINASVNKVDPKLKYLKNLVYLDLSYNNVQISSIPTLNSLKTLILKANNLKNINISLLPPNLEHLDLSENLLSQIPREWSLLKNLKTLDLYKNPIDCECENVQIYKQLINSSVTVQKPLTCHSPLKYAGKDIRAMNCSIGDLMYYDQPEEGSGDVDIFEAPSTEHNEKLPFLNEEDEEGLSAEKNTIIDDKDEKDLLETKTNDASSVLVEEEGSGDDDEGSAYGIIIPDSGVLGCFDNCSTPAPLEPDSSASPVPGLFDGVKMIMDDLNIFKEREPTSSTTKTPEKAPLAVEEPIIVKQSKSGVEATKDVEQFENATRTGELERATTAPRNSTAVYAVVGVGIFIAVLFVVAYAKKRRSRRDLPGPVGEEMKPMNKQPITVVNDKPSKNSSNIPEQIPLINGQNGKPRDDTPKLKSFTPLAHPELPNADDDEEEEEDGPLQNGSPFSREPDDEVEIRPKTQPELLTPQRERVTIRESEIPDSVPRTPLLVHRQKNSEGEIVTTLVP